MDLNRLPFTSLFHFYHQFSAINKQVFWVLLVCLMTASGFFLLNYEQDHFWSMDIVEVADSEVSPVEVGSVTQHYQTLPIELNAYQQSVSYVSGPILPHPTPVLIFWVLQVIAWSVFLGVVTQIRSRWVYFFYLLFVLFLSFTEVQDLLWPAAEGNRADPFFLVRLGLLAVYLGLAYAFQMNLLRWTLPIRIGTFFVLNLLLFGGVYLTDGWEGLHLLAANEVPFLGFLSIVFILFIAKEPINLIVYAATNQPRQQSRLDYRLIVLIMLLWLLVCFAWIDEFFPIGWLPWFRPGLRPMHITLLAAVLTTFTSQHHYHQVKDAFSMQSVFSHVLMALSVLVLSFLMLNYSYTDLIFARQFERLSAMFLGFVGLGYTFYLFYNHASLLRRKINLYFLMALGPRLPITMIWLFGIGGLIVGEGPSSGLKTHRLLVHSTFCQVADNYAIRGEREAALEAYRRSLPSVSNSPKPHYNLASLMLANPAQAQTALYHYRQSVNSYDFPFSRINAANLLVAKGSPSGGIAELEKARPGERNNSYLANNLGLLYYRQGVPDSAISAFKRALLNDLSQSAIYINLARVYQRYGRPAEAGRFFTASLAVPKPSPSTLTNALQYELMTGKSLGIDPKLLQGQTDFFLNYNYALQSFDRLFPAQVPIIKRFSQEDGSPDAALLDTWRMFHQDSIPYALSRLQGLAVGFPAFAARGYLMLGAAYYQAELPGMAQQLFQQAGELGLSKGRLYAARMALELGQRDSAFVHLSSLRVEDENLWEACSRELAMLFHAIGQPLLAETEWPSADFSQDDWTRVGIYADSTASYSYALEAFRQVQNLDSTSVAPYLELGKIANRYGDPFAIENLRYGLQLADSSSESLKIELARAYWKQGAQERFAQALKNIPLDTLSRLAPELRALRSLAIGDTILALSQLAAIVEANPLYTPAILESVRIFRSQEAWDLGNALISKSLEINTEDPEIWYYYAVVSKAYGMKEDTGFGAARAIELSRDAARREEIAREFAEEIRLIAEE